MNLLFLVHSIDQKSGWGRYAADLIKGLKDSGHNVVVLEEKVWGAKLFLSALRARKHIKNCDIVHAFDVYPYGVIAYLANILLGKKLIISAQGTYAIAPLYNIKTSLLCKLALKRADSIIAISNFTKHELLKKITVNKIEIINHGVNLDKFYKPHIDSQDKFILSVGAIKYRKGYHISIPAFAEAKKKFSELKYKIVGNQDDTIYFSQLRDLAKKYEVQESIEFLTEISDDELSALYQSAKVFLLPSINHDHHFEGFGLVFLEAAAAGTPSIGTFGSGVEDAVKDSYNGILVPQSNIEKTSRAITEMLGDKNKWQEMSENSHKWAYAHSLDGTIKEYSRVYLDILNKI